MRPELWVRWTAANWGSWSVWAGTGQLLIYAGGYFHSPYQKIGIVLFRLDLAEVSSPEFIGL